MKLSGWIALAIAGVGPMSLAAETVTVLGQVVLGETKLDGEKIGELSALVRPPDDEGVLATSDRGYMARLAIGMTDGRLTRITPVSVDVLTGSDGGAMRDHDFNPEGAALPDDDTIAIVSEVGPRLAVLRRPVAQFCSAVDSLADNIFRALHQHPVDHCSKYCVGTALLHSNIKSNRFRTAVRKLTQ